MDRAQKITDFAQASFATFIKIDDCIIVVKNAHYYNKVILGIYRIVDRCCTNDTEITEFNFAGNTFKKYDYDSFQGIHVTYYADVVDVVDGINVTDVVDGVNVTDVVDVADVTNGTDVDACHKWYGC